DRGSGFPRGVDELLAQCTEDAVACGVDLDAFRACRFDHSGGRGIDDGGYPAGLGVQQVAGAGGLAVGRAHGNPRIDRWLVGSRRQMPWKATTWRLAGGVAV